MKRSFLLLLILLCCKVDLFAQKGKQRYTNFRDTVLVLDEVTVSDYKKNEASVLKLDVPAKYVPISTNTLLSTTLEERGIQNIQDAARFLPGVRIQTLYGAFQRIAIRGFDNSVILVDGVRDERSSIDNSYPFMDLSSVERIELLKGPASVLFGQSAVGGVINVVRKTPSDKQRVMGRVSYGSWDNTQTTIGVGGKLVGPLNYQANFNYQKQDGWRDNAQQRLSGYIVLGGKLSEKDDIDVRFGKSKDFYSTEIGLPDIMSADIYNTEDGKLYLKEGQMLPGLDKKARYNSESDFMYNRNLNVSATYRHVFSGSVKLTDKFSYSYDDIDYFGTEELSYLTSSSAIYHHYYEKSGKRTYICLDSIYYSYPLRFSHLAQTFNNQLELNGQFLTGPIRHNYLAGYSYIRLNRDSYSGYLFGSKGDDVTGPGLTGHGSVYDPHSIGWMDTKFSKVTPQETNMHGIYLQDLVEFSDKLKMMLAGRYDTYQYKRTSNVDVINGKRDYKKPDDALYSRIKNKAFTGRVGLVYVPVDDLSIFGSYGTYFKPITTFYSDNTIYVDKNGEIFTPTKGEEVFKPEKGYQLELGAHYALNEKLKVEFSTFYIKKYNIKKTLANIGDIINGETLEKSVVGQVGRMDSKGFDIELSWNPLKALFLSVGYGYTDAQVRELADNKWLSSESSKGKQYAYIPKNTFFSYGDYTFSEGVLRNLGVHYSISFQDKVFRNSSNTTEFPSYWMTDLGFKYKLMNKLSLGLNINNLFDKDYYNQALGNQYVPGMPRNYSLSAQFAF